MTGRPDANDVLRNYGEEAVRNGFDRALPYDPAVHTIEPEPEEGDGKPVHIPFKPIDLWKLIDTSAVPERVWQVDGWLPGDDVCLLGGNGGDGKTQLALQLSYCTCIGHPWLGLNVRVGPCRLSYRGGASRGDQSPNATNPQIHIVAHPAQAIHTDFSS